MHKKSSWTLMLATVLLAGCGKQIPKEVIQPGEMENILYDYHLVTAMSSDLSHSENYKKKALRQYVFQKHGVAEADFDSSMVWYTRHTKELALIYNNLGKCFRSGKKQTQKLLALRENKPEISMEGDTVDLWYNKDLFWLTDAPLTNKVYFTIPADSNFKAKDAFLWSFHSVFLSEQRPRVTMGFNVLFDNDSVMGRIQEINASGVHTLYIKPDSAFAIKSVNGFIYLSGDFVENPGVIIDNISLTRYHQPVDSTATTEVLVDSVFIEEKKEATAIDSVMSEKKTDSVLLRTPVRLDSLNAPERIRSGRKSRR